MKKTKLEVRERMTKNLAADRHITSQVCLMQSFRSIGYSAYKRMQIHAASIDASPLRNYMIQSLLFAWSITQKYFLSFFFVQTAIFNWKIPPIAQNVFS